MDDVDVIHMLENQVEQWQRKMPLRSFNLDVSRVGENPLIVRADEQRLRQVMTILIDNATRYSEPDTAIDVALSATAEQVVVRVSDYGTGISPTDLQYIFERFVRFKPRTDGAGLGLSIARALVDAHQGEIYAESEQGQGSVFTVVLPRQAAE
jgi:signal transduction histidine kinase